MSTIRVLCRILSTLASVAILNGQGANFSVCSGNCNYPATAAGVQAAFNRAECGDTVQIQAGAVISGNFTLGQSCAAGKELTVTTTRPDWLPDSDMRIT